MLYLDRRCRVAAKANCSKVGREMQPSLDFIETASWVLLYKLAHHILLHPPAPVEEGSNSMDPLGATPKETDGMAK